MMKRTIIAAAVAAMTLPAIAAADASNTVYGDFRWSAGSIDEAGDDGIQSNNNASRVGFKGSVGGDDLKAIYHLQTSVDNDGGASFGSRFYFAGLKGSFGSVVYGRHSTPYKMAAVRLDPFYDTSAGLGNGGANYGLSGMANGFTNDTLAYTSPNMNGVTLNISGYGDDSTADDHDVNIGGQYKANGITAGVQHVIMADGAANAQVANAAGFETATRVYGGYAADMWTIAVSGESQASDTAAEDVVSIYVAATVKAGEKGKVAASYGTVDEGATEGAGYSIGYFHSVLPSTTVYALYSMVEQDAAGAEDRTVFAVGASHKFSMGH